MKSKTTLPAIILALIFMITQAHARPPTHQLQGRLIDAERNCLSWTQTIVFNIIHGKIFYGNLA